MYSKLLIEQANINFNQTIKLKICVYLRLVFHDSKEHKISVFKTLTKSNLLN